MSSFYRLRVNINGFELKDVKVCLVNKDDAVIRIPNKTDPKIRLKISATRKEFDSTDIKNKTESIREYTKYYEILTSQSNVDPTTMRYYLDPKNNLYLVVEFLSSSNENHYINLDDSCDSLVEMAAKSLLNIKNIEDLRNAIENPFDTIKDNNLTDIFSPSLIRDINMSSLTTFTPINIVQNSATKHKTVQINVQLPYQIKSASFASNSAYSTSVNRIANNLKSIENLIDTNKNEINNHVTIKVDNLNLLLEASTCKENVTSLFTKQLKLPKGTIVKELKYNMDLPSHTLHLEAPFLD